MIDPARLNAAIRQSELIAERQTDLNRRATRLHELARAGRWDATLHQELGRDYDRLEQDIMTAQADLEKLLYELDEE